MISRSAAIHLCLIPTLLGLVIMAGCAGRSPAPIRDLTEMAQDAGAYHGLEPDTRLLAPEAQQAAWKSFLAEHFGPWERTAPKHTAEEVFWGLKAFGDKTLYGENTLPRDPAWFEELRADSRVDQYPSLSRQAIAVVNTAMRVLPTDQPAFRDFDQAGEGYPFDYMQNSLVLTGTPLYASHLSADRAWVLVESRFAYGWVRATDIAWVDDPFISVFRTGTYAALTRDDVPVTDSTGAYRFTGHVGTILPVMDSGSGPNGLALLMPARTKLGRAVPAVAFIPAPFVRTMPIPATPNNFATIANTMLGRLYGWGGLYEDRDCSALTMDLMAAFGIYLPRNSTQQAREGMVIPLDSLGREQKTRMLTQYGTPFLTLVRKPGHIMVYIGHKDGKPVVMHAVWGLKTDKGNRLGREVIGRTVITTLEPGAERPDIAGKGLLIDSVSVMTTLP